MNKQELEKQYRQDMDKFYLEGGIHPRKLLTGKEELLLFPYMNTSGKELVRQMKEAGQLS